MLAGLAGCSTIASLETASRNVQTFELSPVEAATQTSSNSGPIVVVATPVASGAIASDGIVIKPDRLRVAYLPDGRWVDPAPQHIQQLLTRSLSGATQLGLVTADASVPLPDYTLVTDIEAFQAEIEPNNRNAVRVSVRLNMAVISEREGRVAARRNFSAEAVTNGLEPETVVTAFDAATTRVLRDVAAWVLTLASGIS